MIGQPTSLDIALAFTKAWTSHDMDAAARYVADDVVFDGPYNGAKSYLDELTKLAGSVKVLKMIGALWQGRSGLCSCTTCILVRKTR